MEEQNNNQDTSNTGETQSIPVSTSSAKNLSDSASTQSTDVAAPPPESVPENITKNDTDSEKDMEKSGDSVVAAPKLAAEGSLVAVAPSPNAKDTVDSETDTDGTDSKSDTPENSQEQDEKADKTAAAPHPHRNNKKLAAIAVVGIAAILACAAVYMFISAESNVEESAQKDVATTQAEKDNPDPVTPATAEDVDDAIEELDTAADELEQATDDLEDESLSEENLGF